MKRCAALAAAFALLSACQPKSNDVKIALALPLTGDIAVLGQGLRRAAHMAVEEFNASGKLGGRKLVIEEFDDHSDPKEAVNIANRIVSDPAVIAVVGHFNSGCSIPASAIYAGAGIPMVNPASTNPELTRQQLSGSWNRKKSIFRVNPTDDVQGAYAADFALQTLKKKNAAIVHDKTAYGQGVAEEFRKRFEAEGGKVLSFDGIQVGDKDFKSLLTRIKGQSPDMVYFGGIFNEGALLVRQTREVGMKCLFMTTEANYDPEFLRIAGPAAEGAYVSYLGVPLDMLPTAATFVENYKKRYPQDELRAYDHYGYEATSIVAEAVAAVGPDRDKVIDYIASINHDGVLGRTSFDEKGDTRYSVISVFKVEGGKFNHVANNLDEVSKRMSGGQ